MSHHRAAGGSSIAHRWRLLAGVVGALLGGFGPALAQPVEPIDCLGPAPDAEPGTPEWDQRESENVFCANQRLADRAQHPGAATADDGSSDAYRVPSRHDGKRFRFHSQDVTNRDGLTVPLELYRPCAPGTCSDMPDGLETHEPLYPVVILVPGGAMGAMPGAPKELSRWVAQALAEAGYMTVLHDISSFHLEDAEDVLDWVLAGPDTPTVHEEFNPFRAEVDADLIGIAGHSGGGATSSRLGQLDPRFTAIVSYDRSSRYSPPDEVDTPALFFVGDYGIGVTPHQDDPDPDGTAEIEAFVQLRDAGIDSMHLALRAASHLDWSPLTAAGNRYVEVVSLYYTIAWFDRYLKGAVDPVMAADAYARLTASVIDGSGDVHNVSQGFYDPVQAAMSGDPYGGNVPYTIGGAPVADRLSFYFSSRCFLTIPGGGRAESDDMRAEGCTDAPRHRPGRRARRHRQLPERRERGSARQRRHRHDGARRHRRCMPVRRRQRQRDRERPGRNAIKRHGLGLEPNPTFAVPGNCDVTGNGAATDRTPTR